LPADWNVPAVFRRRLGVKAGRQRAMVADGHLLLILNTVPEEGSYRRNAVFFWRDPKGLWRATASVEGLRSLQRLVESYVQASRELEDRLERSDDAASLHDVMSRSVPLARAARNLHLALQEARQAMDDPELINLRDIAGEAERTLELVREDARIGLEFLLARKSEEQTEQATRLAETGHRLNLLAAMFLPVTALGAIFGMNLTHGFERAGPGMFWLVTIAAAAGGGWMLGWTRRGGRS
jgi:Mg2+ and Co2+ transporter CorA